MAAINFEKQEREITRLSDELARLNKLFAEQKKTLGLPENEPVVFDQKEMSPELEKLFAAAKAEAERAGKACAAHLAESAQAPSAHATRRGAVRV